MKMFFLLLLLTSLLLRGNVLCNEVRITSAEELVEFSNDVNNNKKDFSGSTIFLDSDIAFTDELSRQFEPISNSISSHSLGTFDGQGHVISNLVLNSTQKYLGLFGTMDGATIRNIVMDSSCSVTGHDSMYVGSIRGYCDADYRLPTTENCVNMANVTFNGSSNTNIGGIIGILVPECYVAHVKNCVNYGQVKCFGISGSRYNIGGISGSIGIGFYVHFQNCLNYGTITYSGGTPNTLYMGGIVGYTTYVRIENCVSAGKIESTVSGNATGAIIGFVRSSYYSVNITHSFWTNDVGYDNMLGGNQSLASSFSYYETYLVSLNSSTINELNEYADKNDWNKWLFNSGNKTVSFEINEESSFNYSAQLILLPGIVNVNETKFSGWYKDASFIKEFTESEVYEDVALFGLYGVLFTVKFNENLGDSVAESSKVVAQNKSYGELPTANRTGHTFLGWFTEVINGDEITSETTVKITSNQILYAHWIPNNYTISFDLNGGEKLCGVLSKNVTYDETYGELPTANRTGHTFLGWFTEVINEDEITSETTVKIISNQILYAHWIPSNYTITFDLGNGTVLSVEFLFNDTITYPDDPEKEGYTFNGWSPKPERIPAGNMTITAQWTVITNPPDSSEYVEIVFMKKELTKEDVMEIIQKYTDNKFTIERFDVDSETGEINVIIKFNNEEKSSEFVRNLNENKRAEDCVKRVKTVTDYNNSSSSIILTVSLFIFLYIILN